MAFITIDSVLTIRDISITNGDLSLVSGVDAIMQNLKIKLGTYLEEWAFDTTKGIAYYRDLFVKRPNFPTIGSMMKTAILGTDGVLGIKSFTFQYNPETRKTQFYAVVEVDDTVVTPVDLTTEEVIP